MANISDQARPARWRLATETVSLFSRAYRSFGHVGERGPADGERVMIIPGFLANDRTTLGLQRAFSRAGYRVVGWGLGLNKGVTVGTLGQIAERIEHFGNGAPVTLVGWSLGGIYAREVAKVRPELVSRVISMGSPFSGDPRNNNVWRLYEWVARHPVDKPPIATVLREKPPVPTLALWSRRDGIVAACCARGEPGESDAQIELDCGHMAFAVSARAYPKIIAAVRDFN